MNKNILCLLFIALLTSNAYAAILEGVIQDPSVQEQPKFVVTLTPPKDTNLPKEVSLTSPDGKYRLEDIKIGDYLFEISYGTEVIYSEVMTIKGDEQKDVTLQQE